MIIPDVNLLVYAYNRAASNHDQARAWWESLLNERATVAIPWAVALGFVRLVTMSRITPRPLEPRRAIDHVRSWLQRSHVTSVIPGPRHLDLLDEVCASLGLAGRMTTDAHIAALALEHGGEVHSNDADFSRVPSLRWRNPLG